MRAQGDIHRSSREGKIKEISSLVWEEVSMRTWGSDCEVGRGGIVAKDDWKGGLYRIWYKPDARITPRHPQV